MVGCALAHDCSCTDVNVFVRHCCSLRLLLLSLMTLIFIWLLAEAVSLKMRVLCVHMPHRSGSLDVNAVKITKTTISLGMADE